MVMIEFEAKINSCWQSVKKKRKPDLSTKEIEAENTTIYIIINL